MAWQEGNLNRFQTSIQAMDAASQARKRGADTLTDRMKMLQQTGLQMGQWKQDEMKQWRNEWAKEYAKNPNTASFNDWVKQKRGKQPLSQIFKGTNQEINFPEGGQPSNVGGGYETQYQQSLMEISTDQRERAWENYKRTLEAENKVKYDDLTPKQQRLIRIEFETGPIPKGWGEWGYTDKDQDQGINAIMRDAYQFYKAENQKLDEFGNPIWKGTQPTKDQVINAMYNQIKDEPQFAALFKGAAAKDRIRKYVESVYGFEEVTKPVEEPIVEKKKLKKLSIPSGIVTPKMSRYVPGAGTGGLKGDAEVLSGDIVQMLNKINKNPEKYQEDIPLLESLIKSYKTIKQAGDFESETTINALTYIKQQITAIMMPKFEASESYRYGTGPVPGTSQTTTNAPKQYQTPFLP